MTDFNIVLRESMTRAGISQRKLAEIIGCSRAMLYAVLNNEKRLSEKNFRKLIEESVFSPEHKKALRLSYYSGLYEENIVDQIKVINDYFLRESLHDFGSFSPCEPNMPSETREISGESAIAGTITAMLLREIENNDKPFALTNFCCKNKTLNNNIYSVLKNSKKPVDFNRLVYFDNCASAANDISCIFENFRFMTAGYKIHTCDGNLDFAKSYNITYTYFFIVSDCSVFFDLNDKTGIFIADKAINDIFRERTIRKFAGLPLLSNCYDDIFQLKNKLILTTNVMPRIAFEVYPCVCTLLEPEDFERLANPSLPGRENLIKMAVAYYSKNIEDENVKYAVSANGLKKFAETGMISEISSDFMSPLPADIRKKILKKYLSLISSGEKKIFIINTDVSRLTEMYFGYEVYDDKMIIYGNADKNIENAFSGSCLISVTNKKLIAAFESYMDYLIRNKMYFSEELAERFLNDLILNCDM